MASSSDDTVAWHENNGNQVFTEHIITTTADHFVFAEDVDGDADLDVLFSVEKTLRRASRILHRFYRRPKMTKLSPST